MPIAKITGQGLLAIGCAVALLWTCLLVERATMRRAALERIQILREIKQLRRLPQPVPVGAPSPVWHHRRTVDAG